MCVVALVIALLFGLTCLPGSEGVLVGDAKAGVVMITNIGQIPQPNLGITLKYWPPGTRLSYGYVTADNGTIASYAFGYLPNGQIRTVYVITTGGTLFYIRVY
jgi:hypothetical protein